MFSLQRAVPVLQVLDVERSLRWYADVLGFSADPFPKEAPYSFAILRSGSAEIMLQCSAPATASRVADGEFVWSVYLRATAVLELAALVAARTTVLRGPERMFYGLVEFELCDPDGYRVCIGGEVPAGVDVELRKG